VICGKKITYCIYRTEYPWGLSPKIRPAAHFLYKSFGVAFHLNFLILSTIYQYISGENDSNSNTEWSQRHNLCQTVITKVSNNKPFVKSKQSLPQRYLYVGVNSTVTKHSDYFVWKDTSERVARCCDDTVERKRVNPCILKHLFWRE